MDRNKMRKQILAEEFDNHIFGFLIKFKLTHKDIIRLMFGWIDFKLNGVGEIEKKLNKVIK